MAKFPRFMALPVAAVMIVSACSGGSTPAPSTGGGASAAPPASTAAGESGAPAASGVTGATITVTSLWGGAEGDAFQKVLDEFKAQDRQHGDLPGQPDQLCDGPPEQDHERQPA